jgi:hypothetical protein
MTAASPFSSEDAAHRFADQDMIVDDENLHAAGVSRGASESILQN